MRLTSVAVGIITLGLAGYPAVGTMMARATAAPRQLSQSGNAPATGVARREQFSAQQTQQNKQDQVPNAQQSLTSKRK